MNSINHFIFSISLCLIFLELSSINLFYIIFFTLIFAVLIDYDHKFHEEKKSWYNQRTWVQEPFGFILIELPLALILSLINKIFFVLVIIPSLTHIFLDYLCIFGTSPLAPFSKVKKKEGMGIFIPSSEKWKMRAKGKISENYFLIFNLLLFSLILLYKMKIFYSLEYI